MLAEGRSQRSNGDAGRCIVANEPPDSGAPVFVGAFQRSGRREEAMTIGLAEGVGVPQLSEIIQRPA
jgi:hypothetical protein